MNIRNRHGVECSDRSNNIRKGDEIDIPTIHECVFMVVSTSHYSLLHEVENIHRKYSFDMDT